MTIVFCDRASTLSSALAHALSCVGKLDLVLFSIVVGVFCV